MTQDLTYVLNKGMKVFSQLYVGISGELGFATPYEDNAAGKKRQATVNGWTGRGGIKKIVDNAPREGFRITDDVKRVYWGGGNVVWRVLDPYGFELEIQSANLLAIINTAGINSGGEIPGRCIWGRDGKDNILLHESSEEYKTAIHAAETIKKPKTIVSAERKIGQKYLLMDGSYGVYLGKFWVTKRLEPATVKALGLQHDFTMKHVLVDNAVMTACSVPHILDVDQFEAVLIDTKISLYKKASLVKAEVTDILTEEEILKKAKTNQLRFASAAIKDEPVILTRNKPTELCWNTKPATLKDIFGSDNYAWKYLVSDFERIENYRTSNPTGSLAKWKASFEGVFHNDVAFVGDDGTLFTDAEFINKHWNSHTQHNYVGPITLDGPKMIVNSCTTARSTYQQKGVRYYFPATKVESVQGLRLPDIYSPDDLKKWITDMIGHGRIVKIIPTAK